MERLSSADWSKPEKQIARKAYRAAYNREAMAIAHNVRKMAAGINEPSDIWELHDYLTEKRKETDRKYNYRYSVLLSVFGFLMAEGWIKQEDLEGLSDEKLQEIRRTADFYMRI
jgi:hypothetical protein